MSAPTSPARCSAELQRIAAEISGLASDRGEEDLATTAWALAEVIQVLQDGGSQDEAARELARWHLWLMAPWWRPMLARASSLNEVVRPLLGADSVWRRPSL